jgi:hypothetical protein
MKNEKQIIGGKYDGVDPGVEEGKDKPIIE